jgi:hypothetical protein
MSTYPSLIQVLTINKTPIKKGTNAITSIYLKYYKLNNIIYAHSGRICGCICPNTNIKKPATSKFTPIIIIFNHLFLNFDYFIKKYGKFDIEGMGCIYYTKSRFSECWGVIAFDYTNIQAIDPPSPSINNAGIFMFSGIGIIPVTRHINTVIPDISNLFSHSFKLLFTDLTKSLFPSVSTDATLSVAIPRNIDIKNAPITNATAPLITIDKAIRQHLFLSPVGHLFNSRRSIDVQKIQYVLNEVQKNPENKKIELHNKYDLKNSRTGQFFHSVLTHLPYLTAPYEIEQDPFLHVHFPFLSSLQSNHGQMTNNFDILPCSICLHKYMHISYIKLILCYKYIININLKITLWEAVFQMSKFVLFVNFFSETASLPITYFLTDRLIHSFIYKRHKRKTRHYQQKISRLQDDIEDKMHCLSKSCFENSLSQTQGYRYFYYLKVSLLFYTYSVFYSSKVRLILQRQKNNNSYNDQNKAFLSVKIKNLLKAQNMRHILDNENNNILFLNYISYIYQHIKYVLLLKILWVSLALKNQVFFDTPARGTPPFTF